MPHHESHTARTPAASARQVLQPARQPADRAPCACAAGPAAAAAPVGQAPTQRALLQLQRQYGNRHVGQLLARSAAGQLANPARQDNPERDMDAIGRGIEAVRGRGNGLQDSVRERMQQSFGADFAGVRVHTDRHADGLSRALDARAFTTGSDIFFRQGEYNPGSYGGRELLAHELTHVVQQNGGAIARAMTVSAPEDPAEVEAETVARAVMQHEHQAPETAQPAPVRTPAGTGIGGGAATASRILYRDTAPDAGTPSPAPAAAAPPAPTTGEPPAPAALTPAIDDPIDRAIQTGDPLAITAIQDFSKVPAPERLRFIGILNGETSEAISSGHIIKLWQSFGDDGLPAMVVNNREAWDRSVQRFGGDAMVVLPHALVAKRGAALEADLKTLAGDNLTQNQAFVDQRMQQFGLKPGAQQAASEGDVTKLRQAMQQIAWHVWNMRQSQKKLENVGIGRQLKRGLFGISVLSILMGSEEEEIRFDPRSRPANPESLGPWRMLKEDWDQAQKGIVDVAGAYPEIYEAVVSENDDRLLRLSRVTPEAFAGEQRTLLQTLFDRIVAIHAMVDNGELDLLAMQPAVARLTGGGGHWAEGFDHYMAEQLLARHAADAETMQSVAAAVKFAPLLLAPIASTGIGAILEAVAIGASVAIASAEYKQASAQAEAARATPIPGSELVERAPADAAKAKATSELVEASVFAIVAAVAAGISGAMKLADVIQMARLRALVNDEALLARLLTKVPDKPMLQRLMGKAGSAATLEDLIGTIPNPARLETLLTRAGDGARLTKLLAKVPDAERLARVLEAADGARLDTMLERLGSVEKVEGALASQARGEAEGLADAGAMTRVADDAQGILARWKELTPQQRFDDALAKVNAELRTQGVPAMRAETVNSTGSLGSFKTSLWQVEVDPALFADAARSPPQLLKTLYHEARHAEQDFTIARMRAGEGMSAEKMAMAREEGGLFLPADVASEAAARPLPPASPQAGLGRDMAAAAQKLQPHLRNGAYQRILDKRDKAMVVFGDARFDLAIIKSKAAARTGQLNPWNEEIRLATARMNDAEHAFKIADQVYRKVPFEKDAFAVEAEFETYLKAASK